MLDIKQDFPIQPLPEFPRVRVGQEVTIGISAHGNHATTRAALHALFSSVEGDFELILVDDCSPDGMLALFCEAADFHANTKIFSFERNLEYSGSLNAILSHASGEFVFFISNDILVTPAYMATMLDVARHDPQFGILRGTSNFVDNGLSSHNIKPDTDLASIEALFRFAACVQRDCGDELCFDPFLTGDAFMIRRSVLSAIGTLDPFFYGYFADHDLGLRAQRAGFKLVLARGAFALHLHHSNFDYLPEEEKEAKRRRRWARVNENWARFKIKYGIPVEQGYEGVRRIQWQALAASEVLETKLFSPPADYEAYQLIGSADGPVNIARRALRLMYDARLAEAAALCTWGCDHFTAHPAILSALGAIRTYQGVIDEAVDCFRGSIEQDPHDVKTHSNLLLAMNYSETFSQQEMYAESRQWESLHGREFPPYDHSVVDPAGRLRIGFLSGDFRRHSVSYFLEPLIQALDRDRFEICCYSDVAVPDAVTERIKGQVERWHDIAALDDEAVANLVRADQVHILVDLAGHSGSRIRLPVFCRRPAPVQVSWLGYPNTTGLSCIDFRVTDGIADPDADELHAERLVRLENGFLCYRPPEDAPAVAPCPYLQNGFVTFGSFNMLSKISPSVIAVWARILRRIKDARLLLKCHYFADSDTVDRFARSFADFGIGRERIDFRPSAPAVKDHLSTYNEIDIALDTFPYNGTTTTCEALWMGVPVITLLGERHAARVGGSILTHAGVNELIARSTAEYLNHATKLAGDHEVLQSWRASLRERIARSPLCDSNRFAADMGAAFIQMLRSKNL